ncbi:MAG: twin-arginine translocase subunit TatC [Candidatus Parabeggiatoa sp. nov. 3]|nr:MAG: twin-arginine translocase subunit TatC [Gammaproteobacteria bacterium]RKZ66584.1 MAG: twin-arginine translocase subunit TatC [Gammaproteobacteria bacterium]RKZ83836.1 MAG: twin-arginine translocase subunit TatC [Gammaproteobacteria bacterium]
MTKPTSQSGKEMPFVQHLLELRDRLLKMILAVLIILVVLMPFASDLFTLFSEPLQALLREHTGNKMIVTDPVAPFFIPFKLTLVLSIFVAMPYILYHLWAFIAPGLYQHEKSMVFPLLLSSSLLFYLGILFGHYVVLPLVFQFMIYVTPPGVDMMTDITLYFDFVLKMFFAFGLAFQVPIVTMVLIWLDIMTPESMAKKRPYIIVAAFIIGMLMTPPDAISQTLLAIPIWLLFEIGLFFGRMMRRNRATDDSQNHYPASLPGDIDTDMARDATSEEPKQLEKK